MPSLAKRSDRHADGSDIGANVAETLDGGAAMRRTTWRAFVAVAAVLLGVTACVPPSPHGAESSEWCAPPDTLAGPIIITVVAAPPGGTIHVANVADYAGDLFYVTDREFTDVVAGASYRLDWTLSPGLCVHINGSPGVVYQVAGVGISWSLICLLLGGCPVTITQGFPPGTV